jgi:hypothetical protein
VQQQTSYQYQPYPRWLYHATLPACIVPDHEAHLTMGPGWYEHPNDAAAALAASQAPPASDPIVPPATEPVVPPASDPVEPTALGVTEDALIAITEELLQADAEVQAAEAAVAAAQREQDEKDAHEKDALWGAPIAAVVEKLLGASAATLDRVKRFESENPKGPRKGLMAAVDAALKAGA